MRRIDRYLLSEMAIPALVGGLLVLMLLVGNQLYVLLKYLYNGVPVRDVLLTLVYYVPGVLMLAIPAALLLGTALGLNRLERDRELLSMRMAGVRLKRIVLPIILLGVFSALLMFYLQERVIPFTAHQAMKLTQKLAYGSPTAIVPRNVVFNAGDNYFIYVREVDPNPEKQMLKGVMVVQVNQNGYPTWLTIPRAENDHGQWFFRPDPITNEPPQIYMFPAGGKPIIGEATGPASFFHLPKDLLSDVYRQPATPDELTFRQLLAALRNRVSRTASYGLSNGIILAPQQITFYLHRKIAAPLAALVAILIAIPLSVHYGRSGGYVGLLLSVVVAFCFVVSQQWMQVLAETNRLQPIVAAWAPNAFFGILGIFLLLREE